jgi:ribosomal protein S18 acetylase RimI-like enzyme
MTMAQASLVLTNYDFQDAEQRSAFRRDRLEDVAGFLHRHLGRYGDPIDQIRAALQRASGDGATDGGTVTLAEEDGEIVGAVVTNATHMGGYTPENLLVYVASHDERRGQGIGRTVMRRALEGCRGSVALHVEPDNPAIGLYRDLGFTHKYLEMRREG